MQDFVQSCKGLNNYKTTELCISADVPTLGAMSRATDEETIEIILAKFINKLQNDLDPKRKMDTEQVLECARLILSDFKRLNMADVNLVMTNARKGKYGSLYENINMAKVFSWFETYYNQRMELAGTISQVESSKHRSPATRNNGGKKFKDYLKNG